MATIHRQPHPLPLYPINGDLSGVDSASQQTICHQFRSLCKTREQRTAHFDPTVIVPTYFLGIWSNTWEATDPRNEEMVVAIRELLRMQEPDSYSCQDKKKASTYTGITFKINVSSLVKWLMFKLSVTSHLTFTSYGSVHKIHASHESLCSIFNRPILV
jgi:hypothetical protein